MLGRVLGTFYVRFEGLCVHFLAPKCAHFGAQVCTFWCPNLHVLVPKFAHFKGLHFSQVCSHFGVQMINGFVLNESKDSKV